MYNEKVLKHFQEPKNMGKMENPDGVGKVGNIICGDVLWLYIKIGQNEQGKDVIADIKFETFGCVAAISTSSVITELAKGKTLIAALELKKDEIVKSLGSLPPIKIHCSVLAIDALSEAIFDYLKKNKKEIPEDLEKRHQRIEKERELIKEKYKDWIGAEEEMLRK